MRSGEAKSMKATRESLRWELLIDAATWGVAAYIIRCQPVAA